MKANELRLNNYIYDVYDLKLGKSAVVDIVTDLTFYDDGSGSINNTDENFFEPIPINAEWLLKCGFECVHEMEAYADKHHYGYANCEGTFTFMPFCTTDTNCHIKIKYVHQLQNLYFALTEKELEIRNI